MGPGECINTVGYGLQDTHNAPSVLPILITSIDQWLRYFAYLASSIGLHYHLMWTTGKNDGMQSPFFEVDLVQMTALVRSILPSLNSSTRVVPPEEEEEEEEEREERDASPDTVDEALESIQKLTFP